jgi:hypothetical protein
MIVTITSKESDDCHDHHELQRRGPRQNAARATPLSAAGGDPASVVAG